MHRVFISDLHLQQSSTQRYLRFVECLEVEAPKVDEIYILGDLVEMWIGDDDDSDEAQALIGALQTASAQCPIFVMHGNRDFLFGKQFAESSGCQLINDPHVTDDGIVLCHGDALCTDDDAYQQARELLRSETWQAETLAKSLAERKQFGQALRDQSKATNANKPTNIMDVNATALRELMNSHATHSDRVCIHGHTHRPGLHREDNIQRFVLGAWERCGWLCRQHETRISLECFSLAHRYGI